MVFPILPMVINFAAMVPLFSAPAAGVGEVRLGMLCSGSDSTSVSACRAKLIHACLLSFACFRLRRCDLVVMPSTKNGLCLYSWNKRKQCFEHGPQVMTCCLMSSDVS